MQAKRNEMISITKGIAIILMVIMHTPAPDCMRLWQRDFRVALFFFVSGYCFKEKYLNDFSTFAKRKIKGIYWPFVKWSIFFILLHNICVSLKIYDATTAIYSLKDIAERIFYVVFAMYHGAEQLIIPFWFLKELFLGAFLFYSIIKLCKVNQTQILILSLIICFAGYWLFSVIEVPVIGPQFMLGTVFMVGGYILAKHHKTELFLSKGLVVIVLFIIVSVIGYYRSKSSTGMFHHTIYTLPLYIPISLLGCLFIVGLSHVIKNHCLTLKRIFLNIGDRTFKVLTWHFSAMTLVTFIVVQITGRDTTNIVYFNRINDSVFPLWPVYTIVGVTLPLLVNHWYEAIARCINNRCKKGKIKILH